MMIKPQKPDNEVERLQALHKLNILDTHSEERFDRITRVAQNLFHVPIVSVSFIDKEREWYKSKFGLEFQETPRETSFGAYTILQRGIMIVNDAMNDKRFKDNPLVINNPKIRFYLGCPLKIHGQYNVGTLCLGDHKKKVFDNSDLNIIKQLALAIEAEFEEKNASTFDELTQLSNRQGFTILGKQIIKRCNHYDKNVLLIYFDLNKFKFVNTQYGRDESDIILKLFSEQLLKNFRKTDAVARLGEDHFGVLCSGMRRDQLPNVIRRFQIKLSSLGIEYTNNLNIGTVQYDRMKHNSIQSLMEEADEKIFEFRRHSQ